MNYGDFFASLKKLKHVYLLAGTETYYIDKGMNDILNKLLPNEADRSEALIKIDGEKISDLNEIIAAIETAPFFSEKNVILIKNTTLFKTKKNASDESSDVKKDTSNKSKGSKKDVKLERLIKSLSDMLETNYVIFTTKEAADKRKQLYKIISSVGVVLEAEPMKYWQIDKWLNYNLKLFDKTMDAGARHYFVEMVSLLPEISLNYLNNELMKIALYVTDKIITKQDLQTIMAQSPEVSSFALNEAIVEKNLQKSMNLLTSQINERKEALIIALLSRQIRLMIRAKHLMSQGLKGKALAAPLGLMPSIAQKTGEAAQKFSDKLLEDTLVMLADADYRYKFGKCGSEVLERIVTKLINER